VLYIPGNHDVDNAAFSAPGSLAEKRHLAFATYRKYHGVTTHITQYGKSHFIFLNDIIFPYRETFNNPLNYIGGLNEDQFSLLEQYLDLIDKGDLIVLVMHIPLYANGDLSEFRSEDRLRLLTLISPFPHTLSISAHTHVNEHFFIKASENLGWTRSTPHHHWNIGTVCGSWWRGEFHNGLPDSPMRDGTPSGYGSLHINGVDYKSNFHPFDPHPPYKIYTRQLRSATRITINVFNGDEHTSVIVKTPQGDIPLQRIVGYDWYYTASFFKLSFWLRSGLLLPPPLLVRHLWTGVIEGNLTNLTNPLILTCSLKPHETNLSLGSNEPF
jgi:hypothetical protein